MAKTHQKRIRDFLKQGNRRKLTPKQKKRVVKKARRSRKRKR